MRAISAAFWLLVLFFVALFAFLVALGAFSPSEAMPVTVAAVVLGLLWLAHAIWVGRQPPSRDPHRERRGF
jgi:hypothetical protein